MSAHTPSPQPLRRSRVPVFASWRRSWHCRFGIPLDRQLSRVSRLYYTRVTLPVLWWRACGCPAAFTPRVPWWQHFVYQFLCTVGRRPVPRMRSLRE